MPSWKEISEEVNAYQNPYDAVRRKYLLELHELTGRNVIVYYSGWLQKGDHFQGGTSAFEVNDTDQSGFMSTIYQCDKTSGLDLILHTPGGQVGATESIINYLRSVFGTNIRAIIPQIAMSAGTMIACGCKNIVMGKHSSLGPIDPQVYGYPAQGIIEEVERAAKEIAENEHMVHVWQPIFAKYPPNMINSCEKAIEWAEEMVTDFLKTGMFAGSDDAKVQAEKVVAELGSHNETKSHSRHIPIEKAKAIGLTVESLEENSELQDAVLSVHHACIQTLSYTNAIKLIENHLGVVHATSMRVE